MDFCLKHLIKALVKGLFWGLALPLAAAGQTVTSGKPAAAPVKFGVPDAADFEAKNFVADSGAAAVVLCDYGTTRYEDYSGMLRTIHDRVVRLKILKKAGYSYAAVEVPLYHWADNSERLSNLRGITYVRQADGRIAQTKLEASNMYVEKVNARLDVQRFALPAVQEGAVIEYAYTVSSTYTGYLPSWSFQWNIPARWSEYRVNFPRIYNYRIVFRGYLPLAINEERMGVNTPLTLNGVPGTVPAEEHRWVVRHVPALRAEPFSTTLADYRARISCELMGVQWPGQSYQDLRGGWTQKCQLLLKSPDFGQVLEHAGFLQAEVQPLVAQYPDPRTRAEAVRRLVLQHVKYDSTCRWWTETPLKRTWELRRGTAADVNLLLVAALRQAELAAQPVLLSTRPHGRISQEFAQLDQFDYVLAVVALPNGTEQALDATEPLLPANILPARCLAEAGHTVPTQGEGHWVKLVATDGLTHYQDVRMTLNAQGGTSSQVREDLSGYAAQAARLKLTELGEKKLVAELTKNHPEWEVSNCRFVAADSVAQSLSIRYTLRQQAAAGQAQELYLKPLAAFCEEDNPFKLAERRFPVDFGMLQQETVHLTLTLPPGYVADLPKPIHIALPNQGGRYLYVASSPAPGTVELLSRLTLDKPLYNTEEYHALRELYSQMLAKQAEALVIKKSGT